MKETMGLAALLSLAVYFLTAGVMLPMQIGDHYFIILFIIQLNAGMMWCMSACVVLYGKRLFKDEV